MKPTREFDLNAIDDLVHSKLRLGILTLLSHVNASSFNELKSKLGATDGNLSVNLRKLEDAGYVSIEKSFVKRKSLTVVSMTTLGDEAYSSYRQHMLDLLLGRHVSNFDG
ncbi:MAG: DNA-binding MarR family transcriptional regulator [Brevundimonas sp.]|jgi:DNA-binding MarR family transcriptional regulator|uniref:winged helix-turn-helix domain-containing protein n=1 Tax=Brevundimonas sp. TaxID=1871086 RepID=UPI0039E4E5CA